MDIENLLFETAEILLPAFIKNHQKELGGRTGVYMAILKIGETINVEQKIVTKLIGEIPLEKQNEKQRFAKEKVYRLHERNRDSRDRTEFSSFDSEDPDRKKFGGGIRARDYYISVSGFPPHLDQKFVLLLCLFTKQLGFSLVDEIHTGTIIKQRKWKMEGETIEF